MTRLCRNCSNPVEPRKQLCEVCRATNDRMRRLDDANLELRLASICPRCREPWRLDRSRDRKFCRACEDKGEVTKSKISPSQRRKALMEEIRKKNDNRT